MVKMVLEAPADVAVLLSDNNQGLGVPRAWLRGMGWTAARITESFSEIRRALG